MGNITGSCLLQIRSADFIIVTHTIEIVIAFTLYEVNQRRKKESKKDKIT